MPRELLPAVTGRHGLCRRSRLFIRTG